MNNFWRLIDALLNSLFDLRSQAARSRFWAIIFLFLFSGFVISLLYYPLSIWLLHIQDVFEYFLNPDYSPNYPGNPVYNLFFYAFQAFTDPRVLQYLPIFLAPFFIALQTAANYLADVFELDDPGVARHFVQAVALTGSSETMRISHGDVFQDDKKSPVFLIGGPGKVRVDMDSAALFERPDGYPRVIPSAGAGSSRVVSLDGFERFRQAFDLRPHTIELRGEDGRSSEILGRSLDGIPVSATDVSFQFTPFRNGLLPTAGNPYPFFSNTTIENLVYKASSTVKPELPNPSKFEANWPASMIGLVRGKLGGFMNEHKLTEYLATIGEPEADRFNQRADEVADGVSELANPKYVTNPDDRDIPAAIPISKPSFYPRDQLRLLLFNLYANEFTTAQRDKGVELYWVGMGTWRVPVEIYPETGVVSSDHVEAWKLSRENLKKQGKIDKGIYREEAMVQEFATLIQEIPFSKPLTATTEEERTSAMVLLLDAYRLQLMQTAEFMKARGKPVPQIIIQGIECLNQVLNKEWPWSGPVDLENKCAPAYGFDDSYEKGPSPSGPGPSGSGGPFSSGPVPPPGNGNFYSGKAFTSNQRTNGGPSEEHLYEQLASMVGGDDAIAMRLIEDERKRFPSESRKKWIARAIQHLIDDRR